MLGNLLASKIITPKTNNLTLVRERFTEIFQLNSQVKLKIVRAPAGYGKTTMLSHWAQILNTSVAWYTVNDTDNDPNKFWKYLTNSIYHALYQKSASQLSLLLNVQRQLPLDYLVDLLLNELSASAKRIHIIIDDYHLIHNKSIHKMMCRLIDFSPDYCTFYLASRSNISLPIAKWRLSYNVLEIGIEQLLFTYDEARQFYNKRQVGLSNTELLDVLNVTEGWATGLQLLNLSRIQNDDGQHRLPGDDTDVTQFLIKEVLSKLAPPLQNFLLSTSILDQLDVYICDSVMDRNDSQQILLELEKQGVFINIVDSKDYVFKYHHLFKKTLQKELENKFSQDFIVALYEKGSNALYKRHKIIPAIELALKGKLFTKAEQWIHDNIVTVLSCGHSNTYCTWIQKLLNHRCDLHPEIIVMYAYSLAILHNLEDAYRVIEKLEQKHCDNQWMDNPNYASAVDDFLGVKAYILVMQKGDLAQGAEYIRQRLERKPKRSKWDAIYTQYNQEEHILFRTSIGSKGKLLSDKKAMSFFAKFRTGEFKELSMTGYSYGMRAEKLYEWNCFDELHDELEEALRSGHRFNDPGLLVPMYILKSKILALDKQFLVAHAVLDHAIENINGQYWTDILKTMKVLLFLREKEIERAEQELAKISDESIDNLLCVNSSFYLLVYARLLLEKKQFELAAQLLENVQLEAKREEQVSTIIESAILKAICLEKLGKGEALHLLHNALKQAQPYGYVRTFIDEAEATPLIEKYESYRQQFTKQQWEDVSIVYVNDLLKCSQRHSIDPFKSLSAREKEIFSLLSDGASNREIADQLFLSEGTVRVYLSAIYNKLGVKNRAQALLLKQSFPIR